MQSTKWRTSISKFDADGVTIRGYRIQDMMENLDFGGSLFVLFQGRLPSKQEARLINAVLISVMDHGIVVPTAVGRIVAASGVPIQACVAAGILTIGDFHGGAGEELAKKVAGWVAEAQKNAKPADVMAREIVSEARRAGQRVEGFGHPLHPVRDERVTALVRMTRDLGLLGPHLQLLLEIEKIIASAASKPVPLNIDGAMSGILCDMGFDWRVTRAFVFVPRAAGIAAHAVEEVVRERKWRKVASDDEISYDGPEARSIG
jgi:citrate synthase